MKICVSTAVSLIEVATSVLRSGSGEPGPA